MLLLCGEVLEWDNCGTARIKLLKVAFVMFFPPESLRAICSGLFYTWGKQGRAQNCVVSQEQFGNGAQAFCCPGLCSFLGLRRAKCSSEFTKEECAGSWGEAGSCKMTESVIMSKH